MYLTWEAIAAMLGQVASLAPGSRLVMTCRLPVDLAHPDEQLGPRMRDVSRARFLERPPAQLLVGQ